MRVSMFRRYFTISYAVTLGFLTAVLTSALLAQALNAGLFVFESGSVVSAGAMNENFRLLREAAEKNAADAGANTAALATIRSAPVGGIIAWHKNLGPGAPALPPGWLECNGQTVSDADSPFNGITLPDLNGGARFLRGSGTSGLFQDDAFQGHYHLRNPGGFQESHSIPGTGISWLINIAAAERLEYTTGAPVSDGTHGVPRVDFETRPTNMSVVWIIKIK